MALAAAAASLAEIGAGFGRNGPWITWSGSMLGRLDSQPAQEMVRWWRVLQTVDGANRVDTMVGTSDQSIKHYVRFPPQSALSSSSESKSPLRVFIISDVRLCREGLVLLLTHQRSIEVAGSAPATAVIGDIVALQPDIVLLDATVVDVRALVRRLCDVMPDCKIVAFAIHEVDEEVIACVEAGIVAYVKRESSSEEMVDILHQAANGDFACPPKLTNSLFRYIAAASAKQRRLVDTVLSVQDVGDLVLTRREKEIIPFIAQGLTNKEIARYLGLGPSTIKNHVHNILEKLQLRRRGQIAAHARPGLAPEQETVS